jgi:NTE family protein
MNPLFTSIFLLYVEIIMVEKNNDTILKISNNKINSNEPTDFKYTVSEGSLVEVNAQNFIERKYNNTIKFHSWKPIGDTPVYLADSFIKDNPVFSFKAPYIRDDKDGKTQLNFELNITDNKNSIIPLIHVNVNVKRVQRAIIFQGGVSLGAYEAGVFKALVEKLGEQDVKRGLNGSRPLFDIVAGTSIGAMNGAIIVSDILKDKNWKKSADDLVKFWREQESQWPTFADGLDMNPLYSGWWDIIHNTGKASKESVSTFTEYSDMNPYFKEWTNIFMNSPFLDKDFLKDYFLDGWYVPATSEAARRYYSAKQFHTWGTPNVATGIPAWLMFGKFFDFTNTLNLFPRPDNKHIPTHSLKKTLEHFVDTPIITKKEKGEPRFLSITVDVKTGDAVTFDSYEKKKPVENIQRNFLKDEEGTTLTKYYSEYGDAQNKHIIFYNKGIEIDHILASGTFPGFFDYPKFEVENTSLENSIKEDHIFWDGGFRSNTPLRELIQSHRDYYFDKNDLKDEDEDNVPDLEVYIADLWPSELKEKPVSFDLDFVDNRKFGIIFGDKTDYDEQVANIVTDYIDLAKDLRNLARRYKIPENEINSVLDKKGNSKNREGNKRLYGELLRGRFRITKVVRIDHKDDGQEVGNKIFDYSYATIEKLMKDGYCDASIQIGIESIKDEFMNLDDKFIRLDSEDEKNKDYKDAIEKIRKNIQQIQNTTKIEDSQNLPIVNQIESLIRAVRSFPDNVNEGRSLIEEKISLMGSAEELRAILTATSGQRLPDHL